MEVITCRFTRGLGLASVTGNAILTITDVIAIALTPGYNPLSQSVSFLALGPIGWIQETGFYFGAIGIIAFALGLSSKLSKGWKLTVAEAFLFLVVIFLIIVALFKADIPGQEATVHGQIHYWSSIGAGISTMPVYFVVSYNIKNRRRLFIYTIAAGILQIILVIGRGRLPAEWVLFGFHERLIGANVVVWVIIVSWVMLIRCRRA